MTFKPMLLPRETPDLDNLQYPVYVTPKLDGIRCLFKDGVALSRTLKPIPNKSIQAWAKANSKVLEGMDGELIVGNPTSPTVYRDTNSFVMSHDKVGEFFFYHFDYWNDLQCVYAVRVDGWVDHVPDNYRKVMHLKATDKAHLLQLEEQILSKGYEGLVIRDMDGKYKYGRCTLKENNSFKLKRFEDAEAVIVGFEEEMHNGNIAETNELGRTKRSTAKSGMVGKQSLGAFTCRTPEGIEFSIGSGFSQQDRLDYWKSKDSLLGCVVKYKHFPIGVKDKPRHPIFLGFRDKMDM
jgi:DNA ligase-1